MRLTPILAVLLLAGCGSDDELAPGGVTESEARVLNDAAAMLDANATMPEAVGIENVAD
ncbi:hypothetical protein [Sphingomonas japonica]|uniref:Uncharacterized protein n=1 Tax=Sphingomonas japonica TaxID=511662 RepID=A0ABX0U0I4_9SPHN|nr:hypothetical protein [Sphingomonas japonica]NIJ23605.1 hypothetical protein [Sphingomonas japonica]